MKGLRDRVAKLVQLYEEAVEKVNASENQDVHDFLARRLYNMTADIIGSLLLIEDASKAPDLFKKSAHVFVRMAEEEVTVTPLTSKPSTQKTLSSSRLWKKRMKKHK